MNIRHCRNRYRGAFGLIVSISLAYLIGETPAWANKSPYPAMAPLKEYLLPERAEIALARSAAPPSVSTGAEVMVLRRSGYKIAVKGRNGFLCLVERSWAKPTTDPEFWNPKFRAPNCYSEQAAMTFEPVYFEKTRLVLAGRSKSEIARAIALSFDKGELRTVAPGAMCYMMSKQQYLNDQGGHWHSHLMFFASGDVRKSWGANLPGSPVIAIYDPEERVTIFMVLVPRWSDGTHAPVRHAPG